MGRAHVGYLDDHHPPRFGPLAAPFHAFLIDLVRFFSIAERAAADGGNVRDGMRQWSQRLVGIHGLESLRSRAERLAAG